MIRHFEEHGAKPCEKTRNLAEWILDIMHGGPEHDNIDWSEVWRLSKERPR